MIHTDQAVKTFGIPCVITMHNLEDTLAFGNRLIVLKDGKIVHPIFLYFKKLISLPKDLKTHDIFLVE